MKKQLYTFMFFCMAVLFANAQEGAFNYKNVEAKIKKYIFSQPDSVKYYIKYSLAQKTLPDSIKGSVYNIYGIYYRNIGNVDSSIYYYKKSLAVLKNHPQVRTMPLMNIAVAYRNKGDYDSSFQSLDEALEISKKLGLKSNQIMIYGNMSSNYQYKLEYEKAIECLQKAITLVKGEEDKSALANLNQKLANIYMKMRNFTFAKDLYLDCLAQFKARNDNVNHSLTLINYAECIIHMDEVENAKRALREAIEELKVIKNTENLAIAYSKLANIAAHEKQYDIADKNYTASFNTLLNANSLNAVPVASEFIEYLNRLKKYDEALKIIETVKKAPIFASINSNEKVRFDVAAAETYKNTHQEEKAITGLENALVLKDSVIRIHNNTAVNELQGKLQKQLQHEKNLRLSAKNKLLQKEQEAKNKLTYLYVFASVFLIIIVLLFLRSFWLKSRLQKKALKNLSTEKTLMQQQQEFEHEFVLSQKEVIKEKQRELTSWALRMADYQNNVNDIIEKCDNGVFSTTSELKKDLKMLVKQDEYWKQFETRFNSLHPEFGYTLSTRFANLTKNDVEFCSLLKLNLSNKEIASLLQISHESVITRKYRIKKKMEINNDADFEKLLLEI